MAKLVVLEVHVQQEQIGYVDAGLKLVTSLSEAHAINEGDLAEGLATQFYAHLGSEKAQGMSITFVPSGD